VVKISATFLSLALEDCSRYPGSRPGRHVAISVEDNGVGLEDDIRKRIFEPFFTTKDIGEGSGLGLAFAYGVVRQHLGWIDVQSKPGAGSTFTLFLPVARPAVLSGEREITAQMLSDAEIALASQRRSVQPSDPTKNSEIGELRE
jgi:signal transduction histidine kinase